MRESEQTKDLYFSDSHKTTFGDIFNLSDIQHLQDLFADAHGVASIITDKEGNPITHPSNFTRLCEKIIRKTKKGSENCFQSDAVIGRHNPSGSVVQKCLSCGLWDAGASITVGGKHIANWLIGQVRNKQVDEEQMMQYADEIGADKAEFKAALYEVPVMSKEQFHKIADLLFAFANELSEKAFSNMQLSMQIAEKEKALDLLHEREERYSSLLLHLNAGIVVYAPDTSILIYNDKAVRLLGLSNDQMNGKTATDPSWRFVTDENAPLPFNEYPVNRILTNKKPIKNQTLGIVQPEKGTIVWVTVNGYPVLDQTGAISEVVISFIDITERKQAEEALLKSEYEFRLLADAMPQIVWITRSDGWNVFFNQQWVTYTGLSMAESYGHGWNKPFHPDDQQRAMDAWQYATTNMVTYSLECRLRRFDGEYKWWLIRGVPVLDADGAVLKWFGTCTDIDEIKCSEAELIKSKEKAEENETYLRSVLQSTNDIIVSRDLDNNVVFFNKAFDDVTMELFNQHAFVGMNTLNLLPEEGRVFWESILQKVKNGENNEEEYNYKTLLKIADYCTSHVPVLLGSKVVGTLEITKDITSFKKREDELIEAKNSAMESDRLKSAFLANMSHEIRTPMNGILGFAELLKEPDLSGEEQKEYIRIIGKSGARMLKTINDIVDISKIEAGLMKLDLKESNVNEQIEYIYTFFKPEAEAKGLKLSFRNSLPAKEAILHTDREKLYAILTNLVKNAIKFTEKGSIEFGYDVVVETHGRASLRFYVKDTGIGIPQDRQKAIFDRFIQADIEDRNAMQGSGLGLAITESYVEMLGGQIRVESEEGSGSAFYFTLPYDTIQAEKSSSKMNSVAEGKEDVNHSKVAGLKILIAEDDIVSEMFISIVAKGFGKEVLKTQTGLEAVEICRNNPDLDLILMDIQMPEMGGYEATRKIREFNQKVVIIAQTAYGLSGDREKAIAAGCNDYITKPINKDELQALIQKYFGNKND